MSKNKNLTVRQPKALQAVALVPWSQLMAPARARLLALPTGARPNVAAMRSPEPIFAADGSTFVADYRPNNMGDERLQAIELLRAKVNARFDAAQQIVQMLGPFNDGETAEILQMIA